MESTISRCALLLRHRPSYHALSQRLAKKATITHIKDLSSSVQRAAPSEKPDIPDKQGPDAVERRKAADHAQWIKDLNEALPWATPQPSSDRTSNTRENGDASSFGARNSNSAWKTKSLSFANRKTATPLQLFQTKSHTEVFAEKVDAIDHNLHLSPRVAYRVAVKSGRGAASQDTEIARALQILAAKTTMNRVVRRAKMQRAHERPGLKRKRLKKERWRKHFAETFRAVCARVSRLSKQGW